MSAHDCGGCELGRRAFLRDAALAALGVAVAVAGMPASAAGLPLRRIPAGTGSGAEKAYPIPGEDGVNIDEDNEVILTRYQGRVYAFALSCPHQNTALRWLAGAGRFECPKHHSKYRPDGTFISGRATRSMDRLPIRREGQQLLVDVDRAFQEDTDSKDWAAAVVTLQGDDASRGPTGARSASGTRRDAAPLER
jgi:nitrite reductase/ring-hydroxylating ferredoxin subunit